MRKVSATPAKVKTQPKILVALSDLHAGSDVGLMPEEVELEGGQVLGIGKNKWQRWLWDCWTETMRRVDEITNGDPFTLALVGDLTEGLHHRSDEVLAAKMAEHLLIAKVALEPIVSKAHDVHCVQGTDCHTGRWESILMASMNRPKAHNFIQFKFNDVLTDLRHHLPTTSRVHLEAGALGVIAANNRSNAVRARQEPARIFIRGHRHVPGTFSDGEVLVGVLGGWQALTRHAAKVVPDSISRPSCIVLDARHTPFGELPAVHQIVWNPPQSLSVHQA